MLWLAVALLALTLVGMLTRPFGLSPAVWTCLGAAAAWAAGLVDWADARQLAHETGEVLAFLAGMLVVGYLTDRAGVFAWAALQTARLARGDARRLFLYVYLLGVVITTTLSLDTTAVVLTPLVYSLSRAAGLDPIPFVFATTYVANTASLTLPVSNLTNLIVVAQARLPFWEFARVMGLPSLLVITSNLLLFWWMFRSRLPRSYGLGQLSLAAAVDLAPAGQPGARGRPGEEGWRPPAFHLAALSLILLALGLGPLWGIPLWAVALAGAGLLLASDLGLRRQVTLRQLATEISWSVLPFVFALFLLIRGVEEAGLHRLLGTWLAPAGTAATFPALASVAAITALGSNLINNIPMVLVATRALHPGGSAEVAPALYAALLGTNIGPNLTVAGSLATLLALAILAQKGLTISPREYLRVGVATVPPLVLAGVLGLCLALR